MMTEEARDLKRPMTEPGGEDLEDPDMSGRGTGSEDEESGGALAEDRRERWVQLGRETPADQSTDGGRGSKSKDRIICSDLRGYDRQDVSQLTRLPTETDTEKRELTCLSRQSTCDL